jgi:hypothetical protein
MELAPSRFIRLAYGGQDWNACFEGSGEAGNQAAAEALGATETVDDEQVDALGDRSQDGRLGANEASLVKPAASGARASGLPDVEARTRAKVHNVHGCRTLSAIARYSLHDAAKRDSEGPQLVAHR